MSHEPGTSPRERHQYFLRLLGAELAKLRQDRTLSQVELVKLMPPGLDGDLHPKTLATYEQGVRSMSLIRFVELCAALKASPSGVLGRVLKMARHKPCPTCGGQQ